MEKRELKKGDVVQISPENEKFGGMLLVVTCPGNWGCHGYLLSPFDFSATKFMGVAYYRAQWKEIEFVGKVYWEIQHEDDEAKYCPSTTE